MSSVASVITFIETNILAVKPLLKKSNHYYDVTDNDNVNIDNSYSVRPGDASPVDGTIQSATYEQDFAVQITRRYSDTRGNDEALRAVIELLYVDHQAITKQLSLRKSAPILVVGVPSKGAPDIDDKNKFVSITLNYPIKYREIVKGV